MSWWNPFSWFKTKATTPKSQLGMVAHPVQINAGSDVKEARAYGRLYRVRLAIAGGDTRQELKAEQKELEKFLGGRQLAIPANTRQAREYAEVAAG